jgi:hypothetical protein
MHMQNITPNRGVKAIAMGVGVVILGASSYAVIATGHQDAPHAILTCALAAGVFAAAIAYGRAIGESRNVMAYAMLASLICGELLNVVLSADRIVAEREQGQAKVRTEAGAHKHATATLTAAQAAYDAASKAKLVEASKSGCKDRCVALLNGAVTSAKVDLDNARQMHEANPAPTASGSPLADRLGVPAWVIDLVVAGLLAVAANGLAATLIAYGAHSNHVATQQPSEPRETRATVGNHGGNPTPPKGGNRRIVAIKTVATRAAAEADVIQLVARGQRLPSQDTLATRWGVHKGTASKWCQDFETRGIIRRDRDGRSKQVAAA